MVQHRASDQFLTLGQVFVYVEVLQPSQPNGVMLSIVSLPNPEPDKSIAQLPGTSPNFGWASDFFISLAQKNV